MSESEKKNAVDGKRRAVMKVGFALPLAGGMISGCSTVATGTQTSMGTQSSMGTHIKDAAPLSAVEIVRHVTDGSLSAEKHASDMLARYEATRVINAFTWIDKQKVLEQARNIDLMRKKGQKLGPLAGVAVAMKDNIDTVGFPTTGGTPVLKNNFPQKNAPFVELLFNNGAYLFGKTNMHELAKGATSSNMGYGPARNPIDPKRIPGGSSGGSAAALAANIVPIALGTDTAGSVRIPAALCGVVGFRPSVNGRRKLYSDRGVLPLTLDFDTIGPMARSVEDVALIHSVATSRAPQKAASLKGMRIGIPRSYFYEALEPEVQRVTEQALRKLRDAGVVLVEIDLGDFARSASKLFVQTMEVSVRKDLEDYLATRKTRYDASDIVNSIVSPDVKAFYQRLSSIKATPESVHHIRNVARPQLARTYEEVLREKGVNFIAFPTEPIAAPLVREGGDVAEDPRGKRDPQALALIRNTCTAGIVGAPGMSIPTGRTAEGLPVALEFDGVHGSDNGLIALGLAVEKALGV